VLFIVLFVVKIHVFVGSGCAYVGCRQCGYILRMQHEEHTYRCKI